MVIRDCRCCGGRDAYIACPPIEKRGPNMSFSDLVNHCVCWECYIAVVHPVDRKLKNAKVRVAMARAKLASSGWLYGEWQTAYRKTRRDEANIEAWERAIASRKIQRQLYGVEGG